MRNLINTSIELIQKHEPEKGYHVAFSGGKDSIVLLDLVKKSGVKYKAYFCSTSIDPPELLKFIRDNYPEVIWLKPKMSMFAQILKEKMLPTRRIKFCCKNLKEYAGVGEFVLTGIRSEESSNRAKRPQLQIGEIKSFLHPIKDWSELHIWEYIELNNLEYPILYDLEDCIRIGCIGCPMSREKNRRWQFKRYPNHKKAYINTIQKLIDMGKFINFTKLGFGKDEVFEWWITEMPVKEYLHKKDLIKKYYKKDTQK